MMLDKILRCVEDRHRVQRRQCGEIFDDKSFAAIDENEIGWIGFAQGEGAIHVDAHVRVVGDHLHDIEPEPFEDLATDHVTARLDGKLEHSLTRTGY